MQNAQSKERAKRGNKDHQTIPDHQPQAHKGDGTHGDGGGKGKKLQRRNSGAEKDAEQRHDAQANRSGKAWEPMSRALGKERAMLARQRAERPRTDGS